MINIISITVLSYQRWEDAVKNCIVFLLIHYLLLLLEKKKRCGAFSIVCARANIAD